MFKSTKEKLVTATWGVIALAFFGLVVAIRWGLV